MSKLHIWLFVVLAAVAGAFLREASSLLPPPVQAAAPQATSPPPLDIALLDVARVLKTSTSYREKVDKLRKKAAGLEEHAGTGQSELRKIAERLKELKIGSEEYNKLERQFIGKNTQSQLNFAREQKMVMAEEAAIDTEIYERIREETAKIAREKHLRLVLRFDSTGIDTNVRDSVRHALDRPVVYQDGLDITDEVIAALDAK